MAQVTAIVGAQWGDEGKGKIVDNLAGSADFVVRFQGGNNAGHTINNRWGRFGMHLVPCGIFYDNVINVIGNGVALNMQALAEEVGFLEKSGIECANLRVSDRAQIVMPQHILLDEYEEERLGARQYGSTRKGIAPFYADKARKKGIQINAIETTDRFADLVAEALIVPNILFKHLYSKPQLILNQVVEQLIGEKKEVEQYIVDTGQLLRKALSDGKKLLLEGQLGTLRDLDHGIYPYTTSSSPLSGFGSIGSGIPPWAIDRVIGVAKAYSTKVGAGPFVTGISEQSQAEKLRLMGGDRGEYGATTGRPRDVGWFDAVATRYGVEVQGATEIVITNIDVLGYLEEIPVCVAYEIDGVRHRDFPAGNAIDRAVPVYEILPGWRVEKEVLAKAQRYSDLPDNAKRYVDWIETELGIRVTMLSTGPYRDQLVERPQ